MQIACRVAVLAVLVGVFVAWIADDPVRLDGTEGPNNGWLVVILAVLALPWLRLLERGSWTGVAGVLGTGLVIGWTALENWFDGRAVLGASAAPGLALVVGGSAVLVTAGVVRCVELVRAHRSHDDARAPARERHADGMK
jgi:hypothetical protein